MSVLEQFSVDGRKLSLLESIRMLIDTIGMLPSGKVQSLTWDLYVFDAHEKGRPRRETA